MEALKEMDFLTRFTQMKIEDGLNCTICNQTYEKDSVKTKFISKKEYKNICSFCWKEISDKNEKRKSLLRKRFLARKRENLKTADIPERYKNCTFANYENLNGNVEKVKCLKSTKDSVFLWSENSGTGKTHLAVALLKCMAWRGKDVKFIKAPMLITKIRSSFANEYSGEEKIIDYYSNLDVLLIDDIGVEKNTEYCMQCWYTIIDNRYSNCLPTIFTSNHSISTLSQKLGDRIASRLSVGRVIRIVGNDYRLKKTNGSGSRIEDSKKVVSNY